MGNIMACGRRTVAECRPFAVERSGQPLDPAESVVAASAEPGVAGVGGEHGGLAVAAVANAAEPAAAGALGLAGKKWTPVMVQAWDTDIAEWWRQKMDVAFDAEGTGTQLMPSDRSRHVWKLAEQRIVGGRPRYRFSIRAYRNAWSDEEIYTAAAEVHREASTGIVATIYRDGVKCGMYLFCEAEFERPSLAGVWRAILVEEPSPDRSAEDLASLKSFLADGGPPPVVVVWGSMLAKAGPAAVAAVVRALLAVQEAGQRAVVLGGLAELDVVGRTVAAGDWAALLRDLEQSDAEDAGEALQEREGIEDVREALTDEKQRESLQEFARTQSCFVSSAPQTWLFPKCYCVVHHGGAGTTRACLNAGKPCIITPAAFDQFYWAYTMEALGVGYRVGFSAVRAHELAVVISEVPLLEQKAEEIGAKVRAEPGVVTIVEALSADAPNAVVRLDQNGRGVGALGGMRFFFANSAPPPVPVAHPGTSGRLWLGGQELGRRLKLPGLTASRDDLDKKAWLKVTSVVELEGEAGTCMPSPHDKQIVQVMTAAPGLMCLVGQLPGACGDKMYFALSKPSTEDSGEQGVPVPVRCLELYINKADSAELFEKAPGDNRIVVETAKGILLSPACPVLGSAWGQKALEQAKRDLIIGSLDVRLRAQLLLAAVAIHGGVDSMAGAVHSLSDNLIHDFSFIARRVAIELLAWLGGLDLADSIVKSVVEAT